MRSFIKGGAVGVGLGLADLGIGDIGFPRFLALTVCIWLVIEADNL